MIQYDLQGNPYDIKIKGSFNPKTTGQNYNICITTGIPGYGKSYIEELQQENTQLKRAIEKLLKGEELGTGLLNTLYYYGILDDSSKGENNNE